jgi:hypothetical protein
MKSNLLLIFGILPLSLLSIVNFASMFAEATLPPIPAVPTEMQNLSDSTAAGKQKAEAAHPYLKDVDTALAKKSDISPNSATDLDEITIDVLQYAKLRKALEGIWDLHLRERAAARLSKTILDSLIKQSKALAYDGLNSENGKKYREYVAGEITRLQFLLVGIIEYDLEVAKWHDAEAEFNAGKFPTAQRKLEAVDMQIILKFPPPMVTTSRLADLITACEYNVALDKIEAEVSSLRNILDTLTSSAVENLLNSIQRFENKYPVFPAETEQKPYEQLQMDKDAFTLFNELLVREISNDPMSWGVELQKLMNDITKLREFGDEFSMPMVKKQQEKLEEKLILLAKGPALEAPLELELFECIYYLPAGRILFAKKFTKTKTGCLVTNVPPPPPWFYKPAVLPIIPFNIINSEKDLNKLPAENQRVVKGKLNDTNAPQKSPLISFYTKYNEQIVKLEDEPRDMDLWSEMLTYIAEQRVWLVDYNSIGGGYLPEVDDRLNSLESVADKIVKARPEIERFLQQ